MATNRARERRLPVARSDGGRRWRGLAVLTESKRASVRVGVGAVEWWRATDEVQGRVVAYSRARHDGALGRALAGGAVACCGLGALGIDQ